MHLRDIFTCKKCFSLQERCFVKAKKKRFFSENHSTTRVEIDFQGGGFRYRWMEGCIEKLCSVKKNIGTLIFNNSNKRTRLFEGKIPLHFRYGIVAS